MRIILVSLLALFAVATALAIRLGLIPGTSKPTLRLQYKHWLWIVVFYALLSISLAMLWGALHAANILLWITAILFSLVWLGLLWNYAAHKWNQRTEREPPR
jgi:hypothetical protein